VYWYPATTSWYGHHTTNASTRLVLCHLVHVSCTDMFSSHCITLDPLHSLTDHLYYGSAHSGAFTKRHLSLPPDTTQLHNPEPGTEGALPYSMAHTKRMKYERKLRAHLGKAMHCR
jgi:hypothetical protein